MFFGVFRFAKKLNLLNKGGINSVSGALLLYARVLIGQNDGGG